jgi:hypothetical protein
VSVQPSSEQRQEASPRPSGLSGLYQSSTLLKSLPHLRFDQPQLIAIAGTRGSGKTWFLKHWLQSREPRVLVLDPFNRDPPHDDFGSYRRRVDFQVAIDEFAATRGERPGHYTALRRRVVPTWGHENPDNPKFRSNCRDYGIAFMDALVEACPPGSPPLNVRLVLDELSLYVGTTIRGSSFETLVLQGRRMGISMVLATQRAMRIPSEMRSEVTDWCCFHASLERDREVYEEIGWENAMDEAPTLGRGVCWYQETGMPRS